MPAKECTNSSIQLNNSDDEYVELELHSPEVMLSSDEVTLRSTKSVDGQLLRLRVLNIIMSTISFSVMSKVLYTYVVDFKPRFLDTWTGGSFNYGAYQAVLSAGVIVCFANIVLILIVLLYLAMMKPLHATCKITTTSTTTLISSYMKLDSNNISNYLPTMNIIFIGNDSDLALICLQIRR